VAIPAYWIVDPRTATLTVLTLDEAASSEHGMSTRGRTATSVLLDGFAVDINSVFDAA
jgi:Uma2 family endonuclease